MKKLLTTLSVALVVTTTIVSAKTAGSVNGINISVEEANKALKTLTNGKMTWNKLSKEGKKELLNMMAPKRLVVSFSKKNLNANEKDSALSEYWMRKEMGKVEVTDKEAEEAYDKMVDNANKSKSNQSIPPFSQAKMKIKLQLKQDKVVTKLMKNANIKIY